MSALDSFSLCLTLGPLAIYFLLLGILNLSRRPVLVSGSRETAALGLAVSGFIAAGPIQLFLPEEAAARFGPWVWLLLLSFYALWLTLWILLARPRLVVYNISAARLRQILTDVSPSLDAEPRWVGDMLVLEQLGVQLHLDDFALMRNVSLVSTGSTQSYGGWQRLQAALARALVHAEVRPNPRGFSLLTAALAMIAVMLYKALENPHDVAQGLAEMLRLY